MATPFITSLVNGSLANSNSNPIHAALNAPSPAPSSPGYFWKGGNGQVYVQGSGGINSAGTWDTNTANYWNAKGFHQTADSPAQASNNAATNTATTGNTGGNTGGTSTGGQTSAQTAAASALLAQHQADFQSNKTNAINSIGDAVGSGGTGYHSSILDLVGTHQTAQNSINNDAVQNELSREQGARGVTDMVGNGIKSAGVQLANAGAGSSSAGEALARAYGLIGRQQMSSVGNQFAQGQNKVATEQGNLALQDATDSRHTSEAKANIINNIVTQARQQLGALNQAAMYASIPDRIDIEAQIAQTHQQALDALSAYDHELGQGQAAHGPMATPDIQGKASTLLNAGTAPEHQFDYTTDVPNDLQNTGQFASSLPIFNSKSKQPA